MIIRGLSLGESDEFVSMDFVNTHHIRMDRQEKYVMEDTEGFK